MKFDKAFLLEFNFLIRMGGVSSIAAGLLFLLSAYAVRGNRILDAVVGICAILMGVAVLVAKPVTSKHLERIRGK
jgi:uncharacterized membrane protein HdeD (DUF308 family)